MLDAQNKIIGVNTAVRKLFEAGGGSIVGKSALEIFAPWQAEINLVEHIEEGQVELTVEVDGKPSHIDLHITPLRDRKNEPIGRVLVARDITRQKELENELRYLNIHLESMVEERTRELAQAYDSTLEGWAKALEIRDKETEGHSRRVTALTVRMAQEVGMGHEEIEHIRRGALLHDIGKMAIPDEILNKPSSLTAEEMEIMRLHPTIAKNLLANISFLAKALEIPCYHHERWDGQGYPMGLKGLEIPISARIFALVDQWDALLSDRPYRKAWQRDEVVFHIQRQSGKIYDPELAVIFLRVVNAELNPQ